MTYYKSKYLLTITFISDGFFFGKDNKKYLKITPPNEKIK